MPIKLVILDLDGVLVDSRELHFYSLNRALAEVGAQFVISKEEHLSKYDGLPTTKKLKLLTESKGLPADKHNQIWASKQKHTQSLIKELNFRDESKIALLKHLKAQNYTVAVASNAIRDTIKQFLIACGIIEYVDYWFSNEDVKNPKPNTEMYLQAMIKAGVNPNETLIVEDSHIGRQAAIASGAHLCAVTDNKDVTFEKIMAALDKANKTSEIRPKWQGGNMNVLIPMAGAGSRFQEAGYTFPKPLIDVRGKPMIQWVIENLNIDAKHIFIVQKAHVEKYSIDSVLRSIQPNCEIVQTDGVTQGAACTTLLAEKYIDNDNALLIANSDQFIDFNSNEFLYSASADNVDGAILTFKSSDPKWSYVKLDENGYVDKVSEKVVISDISTVGLYYWRKGLDYVKSAKQMISKNIRHNNEFYVSLTYQQAIDGGAKIKIFNIPTESMWGIGDPSGLENFIKNYGKS